ncbi:hypothetical protein CAter10_2519 [Collimonas arenae]|uniref:hypothetical protein n=1 Tax=Collimonas arenae TaxID=279058 RepID=UPI0007788CFA|nr:hypothetical protein [Collimonas arenae]AMP00165.1 hypothetical protein CAter10_2519 [Collimonas arenae]
MTTTEKLTPEQAALLSGAAAVDNAVAPVITHDEQGNPIADKPEVIEVSPFERNRDMLNMGLMMLTPAAPFLKECYTPDVVEGIAAAFTAVEIKRGWDVGKFMSPELTLALVALPPTIKAYLLGVEYIAAIREKNANKPNPETIAAPGHHGDI